MFYCDATEYRIFDYAIWDQLNLAIPQGFRHKSKEVIAKPGVEPSPVNKPLEKLFFCYGYVHVFCCCVQREIYDMFYGCTFIAV